MGIFEAPNRAEPPYLGDERTSLEGWLDWHRQTLLAKCAGLDGEQLARRAVPPSTLSLLGLVRHMAEVERSWFRRTLGGASPEALGMIYATPGNDDEDFDGARAETAGTDRDVYLAEVAAARAAAAGRGLDEVVVPHRGRELNLRWIYTHMIEEYARHNGHADLLRECIDGVTGD